MGSQESDMTEQLNYHHQEGGIKSLVFFKWYKEPHSSTLAWKIPWTEEPGRLQSMGLLRVGND